jgi:hypothetical protein
MADKIEEKLRDLIAMLYNECYGFDHSHTYVDECELEVKALVKAIREEIKRR